MTSVKREPALRRVLALRPWSYTAYNGVGVRICTRLRSFILWWRGLDGKRPRFYGEPRHLTGLPPSSSEIFRHRHRATAEQNDLYRVHLSALRLETFEEFLSTRSGERRFYEKKMRLFNYAIKYFISEPNTSVIFSFAFNGNLIMKYS